jgi:dTDP-4-amino-4,6-dideoxygalactose transaminase
MIEDNAQSPFATEGDQYAGTIGHIGVFSFNVHKHIQAGEGGVVVTNDQTLGDKIRAAINHGELGTTGQTGLNLRITEPIAAIADAQLSKAGVIIKGRIELAEELTDMFKAPWIIPPHAYDDCRHVYYIWAARVLKNNRDDLLTALWSCNFPIRKGYSPVLNRVFKDPHYCAIAEQMEDDELITFEVCAYDPTSHQRSRMREIVKYATDPLH